MHHFEIALDEAIEAAGGAPSLAQKLGAPFASTIHNWRSRGGIPKEWGPLIESVTGVDCERLCPHTTWVRVKDRSWKANPAGRPLADLTAPVATAERTTARR